MKFSQTTFALTLGIAALAATPGLTQTEQSSVTALVQVSPAPSPTPMAIPVPTPAVQPVGSIMTVSEPPPPAAPTPAIADAAATEQAAIAETAYDRVVRTGILHCGYYIFAPLVFQDAKTGALSGLSIDMMGILAANAGLKVQWTQEVDFDTWAAGLKAGRFDALCTPAWPDTNIACGASYTRPLFYNSIGVYARGGDTRFDENIAVINNPAVTIATIEGSPQAVLAQSRFPQAHLLSLPSNASVEQAAAYVVGRKADVMLWDGGGADDYLKTHPGSLHNISPDHPIRVMPFELAVNQGEYRLRDLLDTGVQTMEDTGLTDQLLTRWERTPNSFYRVAKPYIIPTKTTP